MAKKQTRRSISVSRTTYERLKSFCETNGISMSQVVETRVADFLGEDGSPAVTVIPAAPRPVAPSIQAVRNSSEPLQMAPLRTVAGPPQRLSAAARYAAEPPLPIIKRSEQPAPKPPSAPKAEQIFTF